MTETPETEFFYHSVQVEGKLRYESIDRDSAVTFAQGVYRDEGVIPELFEVPYVPNWKREGYSGKKTRKGK